MRNLNRFTFALLLFSIGLWSRPALAWYDETHLAIAKAAGYSKWYNAAGPDMVKIKAGKREGNNHYCNNPPGKIISRTVVENQIHRYNREDSDGHLYGAIVHAFRDYLEARRQGKYAEYYLAFCCHYVGDLSMPFHHTVPTNFSQKTHKEIERNTNKAGIDGIYSQIRIYPIKIDSEKMMIAEIARIANISLQLAQKLEAEKRLPTQAETDEQLGHSASLFKAILDYTTTQTI